MKFISRTTMAMIFTDEIESAVPRNNDTTSRWSGCGSMLSGNGHLAETIMGFSGNRPLMDAWQTLSKSPEIQALIANGVAMIGGLMMQGRSAMRE